MAGSSHCRRRRERCSIRGVTRLPAGSENLTMYCVLIVVDTPGRRVSGARLRAALTDSAAGNDRTEHIFMDVRDGLRVGPLVCFETAFPDMSRQLTKDGAQLLVAQSSTSTFQHSWAPEQHASLGALRAAESGRPMVHATLTGVSAAYGPRGERLGAPLGTDVSGTAVYDVPLARGTTLYVRWGAWPVYGALVVLAVFLGVAGRRSLRTPAPMRPGRPSRTAGGSPGRPGR